MNPAELRLLGDALAALEQAVPKLTAEGTRTTHHALGEVYYARNLLAVVVRNARARADRGDTP